MLNLDLPALIEVRKRGDTMFTLYEKVEVTQSGEIGTIIDIGYMNGEPIYTVESDKETSDEYGTLYPLMYCKNNELRSLNDGITR